MDESKADMIVVDHDLAYTGTDRATALLVEVDEAVFTSNFSSFWSDRRDDIPEFPHDVA